METKKQMYYIIAVLLCTACVLISIFLPWNNMPGFYGSEKATTTGKTLMFIVALAYISSISPKTVLFGIIAIIINLVLFGLTLKDYIYITNLLNASGYYQLTWGYWFGAVCTILALILSILLIISYRTVSLAIQNGDYKTIEFSSEGALAELQSFKTKLDLGVITQEEYDKKKTELSRFIK